MEDSGNCAMGRVLLANPKSDGALSEGVPRRDATRPYLHSICSDPGDQLLSRSSFLVSFGDFGSAPLDVVSTVIPRPQSSCQSAAAGHSSPRQSTAKQSHLQIYHWTHMFFEVKTKYLQVLCVQWWGLL